MTSNAFEIKGTQCYVGEKKKKKSLVSEKILIRSIGDVS